MLEHGAHGGSLVAAHGGGPLLCSHLDTSLDGGARDRWVTGRDAPVGALRLDDEYVDGFGLGVARAPVAAALVAFAEADAGSLLLAGSGTHRASASRAAGTLEAERTGVQAYLAERPRPDAAVVAKSGPTGVLWQEPGACYLSVQVRGRSGVVLAPASATPPGGIVAHAGSLLDALAAWCGDYASARPPVGQIGAVAGIGAVRSGWTDKPDLLPALLEIGMYVVTLPGEDVSALAAEVRARTRAAASAGPLRDCSLSVLVEESHPSAATMPDASIVRAAEQAWRAELGTAPPDVTAWTGSTDGVVLRGHGIDTVRLGPSPTRSEDDPRRDRFEIAALVAFARIYRRLLVC